MTDKEQILFVFLRKGLWGDETDDAEIHLTREDWKELFETAHSQAVTGLLIDGATHSSARPDDSLWRQWVFHLLRMEQTNEFIAARGDWWVKLLAEAGIQAEIFKGTSVAAWYPLPLHRSYGDLDIVVTEGWQKLTAAVHGQGFSPYRLSADELAIQDIGNLSVEFHTRWERLYNPITDRRLRRLCRNAGKIGNELYFVCLILHMQRHFLTYGIGLKQVCDVAVMLHSAQLDRKTIAGLLQSLHSATFSRLLFGFIDLHIGGTNSYPLPPISNGEKYELLENVILRDGYRLKMKRESDAAHRRISFSRIKANAWFWMKRCLRLSSIMPGEACCFLLHKTWRLIVRGDNSN